MTATHDTLYQKAKEALDALFGDNTVEPADTRESLLNLREEIEIMLGALEVDVNMAVANLRDENEDGKVDEEDWNGLDDDEDGTEADDDEDML